MLLQLNITNFALIEKLSISFGMGLNVLSGETGAGKSILIDAISYVLGGKFSKDLIRTGEDKTYVEAVFTIENPKTIDILKELEVEYDDLVIISRETFQSGKSIAKVNGKSLLLASIKQITSTLLDIHGQHENQNLLDASNHIHYLDYFGQNKLSNLLDMYAENYNKLSEINNKILDLTGKDGERDKIIDFLKYQIDEINSSNLRMDEDTELEEKYAILSNAEKINSILSNCHEQLYDGNENTNSIYDSLGLIIKDLRTIEKHIDKVKDITALIENAYYSIEQSIQDIRSLEDNVYYDENELEYINGRIYQISMLKKKYGNSIADILEYKKKIESQYDELINSSVIIEKLKVEKESLNKKLTEQAQQIHEIRSAAAEELESKVKNELAYIGLEKSIFKIDVLLENNFTPIGLDKVQFLISTNPGEPLKSLEKVVSGGELSRIMLALKTVFVNKDRTPSVIFDEIDTGISGRVAQSVAEKMYLISNIHQVFCVTHLPQIACISDIHYLISKKVDSGKTYTIVSKMSLEQKEYEIARMIGGFEVTKLTLEHSKELIKMAETKKKELYSL